jgi:hypothetical protein
VGSLFNRKAPCRVDLTAENRTMPPERQNHGRIVLPLQPRGWPAAKSEQNLAICWPFQSAPSEGYFSEEFGQSM